jgi:hypothetical protein
MSYLRLRSRKVIATIVCVMLSVAVVVLQAIVTTDAFMSNTLDHSWIVGLAASLQQGQISGRDFFFTYGVLSQMLAWIGMMLNVGGSAVDGFFAITLVFRASSFVLLGIVLLLIKQINWKFVSFVFLAVAVLHLMSDIAALRMVWVILCAVVLQRAMSASTVHRQMALALVAGGLCFVAQLFTAELGLLTASVALIVLGSYAVLAHLQNRFNWADLGPVRRYVLMIGAVAGVFTLGNVLIGVIFKWTSSSVRLFDYQLYNLEIIKGYNNTMGSAWRPGVAFSLGLFILVLYAILFVLFYWRRLDRKDGYLLVSLLVSSLAALKGLTLRSDWSHITIACIPLVVLLLLLGHDWLGTKTVRAGWVGSLLLLVAIWPGANFSALTQLWRSLEGQPSLISQWQAITSFRAQADQLIPSGLTEATEKTSQPLLIFPYQNFIAAQLDRPLIAPVLLSFLAHTEALQNKYVEMIAQVDRDPQVIYGLDGAASWPIDGVQQIARVPVIFEYLYRNFELQSARPYGEGYYLLQRRSTPVKLQATELAFRSDRTEAGDLSIYLDEPATCSLVRLGLQFSYPLTTLLGRPNPVHAQFLQAGNVQGESNLLALETDKDFATYVSLIEPAQFYQVFGIEQVQAKTWDTLTVTPVSTGLFGVPPSGLEVNRIECITFPR